jgi:hypothetical protein
MLRIALLSAVLTVALGAAPALAERNNGDSIPPNCTLDPFTGKMNCPVPKATLTRGAN